MEVEGNQTTGKTSIAGWTVLKKTAIFEDFMSCIFFPYTCRISSLTLAIKAQTIIVVLGLWEANKTTKKILARSEKKTFGSRYGII